MNKSYKILSPTKTTKLFDMLNIIVYIGGMKNFMSDLLMLPETFIKIYDKILILIDTLLFVFMIMNFISVFKQTDLTILHYCLRNVMAVGPPFMLGYNLLLKYKKTNTKNIIYDLIVTLKQEYNNGIIEERMIKKIKIYLSIFTAINAIAWFGCGLIAIIRVIFYGEPFIPFVTPWPDMKDKSASGTAVRLLYYLVTMFFVMRIVVMISLVVITLIVLSHQYMNLRQYFYDLNDIFIDDANIYAKEKLYEEAFKKGIRLHILTLELVHKCQAIFWPIFSCELAVNIVITMTTLPSIINSGKSLSNLMQQAPLAGIFLSDLVQLGFSMWNAGDITVEASKLPTAMYSSGWEICRTNTERIRKLLVISMFQAQQPVVMRAFKIIELSYDTYVTVVKTSYSIFSVFY